MNESSEVMRAAHAFMDLAPEHGGRLTDRVELAWIFGPDTEGVDPTDNVSSRLAEAGVNSDELTFEGRWGEAGRGWSTDALLLVLGGGILATQVIAAINEWDEFIRKVARLWQRLRRSTPPMLSLGAVKLLCVADLLQRGHDVSGLQVLFAGDVGGGVASDLSYSGQDLFLILLTRESGGFYLYLVDATGRLLHFADGDAYQPDIEDNEVSGSAVESRPRLSFLSNRNEEAAEDEEE